MKLIYILGTDGAGKTTLSKKFIEDYSNFYKVKYVYWQYFPFFLKPLKFFAKKFLLNNKDEFKEYNEYIEKKKNITTKKIFFTKIYSIIWIMDYLLQIWGKVLITKLYYKNYYVLVDRFYLDTVVHLAFLLNYNNSEQMLHLAKKFEIFFPKPKAFIFLNVDEHVAFKRKNDIQSVRYLRERKSYYLKLKDTYNFIEINANLDLQNVMRIFNAKLLEIIDTI